MAKKATNAKGLEVPFIVPTQFPAEPQEPLKIVDAKIAKKRFHWGTYALNEAGNEVEEIDYMNNFNKRLNKVIN